MVRVHATRKLPLNSRPGRATTMVLRRSAGAAAGAGESVGAMGSMAVYTG